ncbi:Phosphatidylinositol glycan anchor biosynthesis class U [Cryptosporidium sp. chipmunk genotype I]|uniref:Phosphatidylinositol glycan anchor biosynthesis class U n=1 Tax=Cryptosporidium sp. chipmunk genotype I TaxID=1280935 RepID=UPI00351A9CBC|nr:Phosphatidylinositol glycan anchor biosynthesis class U [Cryptosporidium sp. chipmunk genotype I]
MKKELILLIFLSILIKLSFFLFVDHDLEKYTDGFFGILGQNFAEVLEFCALKEYGISTYYESKRVNFPVILLELISGLCGSINSKSGLILPFIAINLIQILQGMLIYSYLIKSYPILSTLSKTIIEKNYYEICVNFLLGVFWINPISIYTSSLLSFGIEFELFFQLLLLWISVHSSRKFRASLPIICGINVYYSPVISISLIPATLSLFLLGNHHFLKLNNSPNSLDNYKMYFNQFLINFQSEYLSFRNIIKITSFFISFTITFLSLHVFSFILVNYQNNHHILTFKEYIYTFIIQNFTFLENKDLNPYLNIYWFLMYCIAPEFRLFFQIILGSCLIIYAFILNISLEKVPFKALQSQLLLCFIFKSSPTFINYLLIFFFILFDSVTLFESKSGFLASFSFILWMICIPSAFLIRPIWILENSLDSNLYYFLTLIGNFSIVIFIGEWIKSLFNNLVKCDKNLDKVS